MHRHHDINHRILQALGLDPETVRAATLRLDPGCLPVVDAEIEVGLNDDGDRIATELRRYHLVEEPEREALDALHREALDRYGNHDDSCPQPLHPQVACDCGYGAVREQISRLSP